MLPELNSDPLLELKISNQVIRFGNESVKNSNSTAL